VATLLFIVQNFTMHPRRVVVTGIGIVSPVGLDRESAWKNIQAGKSGISKIESFDATSCAAQIAGEIRGFDPTTPLSHHLFPRGKGGEPVTCAVTAKEFKRTSRFICLSLSAACEAYSDAGLDAVREQLPAHRIGCNIGVGLGSLADIEANYDAYKEKGFKRISPFFIPQVIANLAAGQTSILLNTQGTNYASVSACASSAHSIGESYRAIQRGEAEVFVAGGAEAVITPLGIGGFAAMRALSTRNDAPEAASRPWDRDRDGFVMGEGATTLILEEYEFAKRRGAKIYAEIRGYGPSSDAHHITSPLEDGSGGYRAMELALQESGLTVKEIDYVNAHGTSTPAGDIQEARAISRLLGGNRELHVSSTKSMMGHLIGAAGAIEAALSILAMRDSTVPPTINLENIDPAAQETGLNFTPNHAVKKEIRAAISNSFGFGGTNVSLLFTRGSDIR
jgi:3-oxoacyl-[acyl-carrier-protein] synthase II